MGERQVRTEGVFDILAEVYHADDFEPWSLSKSGAVDLLPVPFGGCPAKYLWKRTHPGPPKRQFDIGHAAHLLLLGAGADVHVIDAADYRKNDAKNARAHAYENGITPLLTHEYEMVAEMVEAIRAHPFAGACFENGRPELSGYWRDSEAGVFCRIRPDWTPTAGRIVADYKTAASISDDALARVYADKGYWLQAAWTTEGLRALGLIEDPVFVLVFQEKEPPYLVRVMQPSAEDIAWGRIVMRKAIHLFAACLESGHWPGYDEAGGEQQVTTLAMPAWSERRLQAAHELGAFDVETDDG